MLQARSMYVRYNDKIPARTRTGPRSAATAILFALAVLASSAGAALAHVPALESGTGATTAIDGPDVSRAIYGYLAEGEEADAYVFSVAAPVTSATGVIVPAYAEHADFRPVLRLFADGEEIATIEDPMLPERPGEFEPFSLTTFWEGGEEEVAYEPGIEYALVVDHGEGTATGRYVLVFGGGEAFTGTDVATTLRDLPTIWFGMYGDAPFHLNWFALVPLALTATLIPLAVLALVRLVRRA
jgi:hypothetical protein